MSEKTRRSAQDNFNSADHLLGKGSFAQAFPEIESIRLEYSEEGELPQYLYNRLKTRNGFEDCITEATQLSTYINCRNPKCTGGGFHLANELHTMIALKKEVHEGTAFCVGSEGSPKGRIIHGPCDNMFKFRIEVKYKP